MVARRAVRTPRRKLIWARMTPAISVLANVGAGSEFNESQDLLQTFRTQAGITAGPVGLTVMRMRFAINAQVPLGTVNFRQGVLGVRVMDTTEALAAEVDATPYSPTNDPHADWMCFEPFGPKDLEGTTGVIDHHVDVRSMRKLDELGQTLVAIVSSVPPNAGPVGTILSNFSVTSSVLLALP